MKNIRIIKNYFTVTKANKKISALLIFFSMLANGPYFFVSLLFSMTIDSLAKGDSRRVILTMMIYFGLKIMSKVFKIFCLKTERKFYNDVYDKIQNRMVTKLNCIDMNSFALCNKGELLNIANEDTRILAEFGTWLSEAVLLTFSFLVSIVILARISFGLMIFGLLINILVIYILNIYNEKYEKLIKEGREKADQEMRFYRELLSGLKEIRIFCILEPLYKKYHMLNEDYIKVHNDQIRNRILSNIINPAITMCMEIVLMVYACYQCLHGVFEIDTVLIIQSYFGTMFIALSDLVTAMGELRIKHVSINRYKEFLEKREEKEVESQSAEKVSDHSICMDQVSFSYGSKKILNQYSIKIPQDTLNALVGASGCGKSTFFNLLLRFEKVSQGMISIGGQNIRNYSNIRYAEIVSCVTQQPYLFHMSIYDNFALINPDMEQIRKVCMEAGIHDYIASLPDGYNTMLDEGGENLSGGQRQRIAIARALLKNAKILLLDEITSALDEETASGIMQTVKKLSQNHTILMITHKTVEQEQCHNIVKLDRG